MSEGCCDRARRSHTAHRPAQPDTSSCCLGVRLEMVRQQKVCFSCTACGVYSTQRQVLIAQLMDLLAVFSEAMYFHSLLAVCFGAFAAWLEGDRLPEELQLICRWSLSRTGFFCKSILQLQRPSLHHRPQQWPTPTNSIPAYSLIQLL